VSTSTIPIADIVPHRPPSLLLDELLAADEEHAVARVVITGRSLYFDQTGVPALVALEYMAQTIAAFAGVQRRKLGEAAQLGFLLGCRRLSLEVDAFRPGDDLRVEARRVWISPPVGQFECRVLRGDQAVASATLSVYEGPLEGTPRP
jgi:predicted hotdog family 3-hydroxylacyl-ACP dehydratase